MTGVDYVVLGYAIDERLERAQDRDFSRYTMHSTQSRDCMKEPLTDMQLLQTLRISQL